MKNTALASLGVLAIVIIPVWILVIAPTLLLLPSDWRYEVDLFSQDNFFDEQTGNYTGPINSRTDFHYEVVGQENGNLLIKNVFDVRTPEGEPIFAVDRMYGVDPKTLKHVSGLGDRDRDGYLFAPKGLKAGQDFTYWHINYDGPAAMEYQGTEEVLGLRVNRYKSTYQGVDIDQTASLGHLPGVPERRGVNLEPVLELWIEPLSGYLVKYQDNTVAYYYDISTGERINPWNKFNNQYSKTSIIQTVSEARALKKKAILFLWVMPIFLGAVGAISLLILIKNRNIQKV